MNFLKMDSTSRTVLDMQITFQELTIAVGQLSLVALLVLMVLTSEIL